jgi:glyoxylase-like metal-dependent hydrolase (beta-lactamase superfamily II)
MSAAWWTVGEVVIHRIDEVLLPPETGPWLLPTATPDLVAQAPWLTPDFAHTDGYLHLAVHSFAVRIADLRVLVDTGVGNGKVRANPAWHNLDTPYLARLHAAEFSPACVDLVIMTHLHMDHVGWNTCRDGHGDWVPTFPNARYLASRAEDDYWSGVDMAAARRQMFADSVQPVRDAGQLDLVEVPPAGVEVAPGLRLLATPGHTPGQVAIRLTSAGRTAVISGDFLHHPVQLSHPAVRSSADVDPDLAARTRRALLAELADTDTLLLGSHFPPPTAGLVRTDGNAYRLLPVPAQT